MSIKLMDNVVCNELPVLLLFYEFIFYSVAGMTESPKYQNILAKLAGLH